MLQREGDDEKKGVGRGKELKKGEDEARSNREGGGGREDDERAGKGKGVEE